ncbi:MAG: Bpu10I family restriction endonuclease [Anaerolineae bacterium]|nr:Bpu10I family restriction endonuclease [Anaerolineae bacterium]MCX8068314.1 Bpu10I family restriction endonuclease [Anaerolineae bacterium]MDW7992664.1 Bpu10I family restriction endonuclease [Anaerolineae bacterium]
MTHQPEIDREAAIHWLQQSLKPAQVHGRNILTKLRQRENWRYLSGVIRAYQDWVGKNEVQGYDPEIIQGRVDALNQYKLAVEGVPFSAQSKFHSSVLEEFLYYLFRDLVLEMNREAQVGEAAKAMEIGGIRAYSNLYFAPASFQAFLRSPSVRVNEKDQDFAIYREVQILADRESRTLYVPVVSIECKTYIDKTMLEGSIATAEKIKMGNPYCLFVVVTEWYDVSYEVDPKYSRIDQIYVLRREKRRAENPNPIQYEVVLDLFRLVHEHLRRDWSRIEEKMTREGKIL